MSTIVGVRKRGVVALAADTMSKWGGVCESAKYITNSEKILKVGRGYVAVSGPTSMKLVISEYFRSRTKVPRFDGVMSIFTEWLHLHRALKESFFLLESNRDDSAFESSQFDALIISPFGLYGVAAHRAVQEFTRFYAYGDGWQFALGAMHVAYEDEALSAEDVARLGVQAAADFDDSTGEPIRSHALVLRQARSGRAARSVRPAGTRDRSTAR